jgi:hypothetical protein
MTLVTGEKGKCFVCGGAGRELGRQGGGMPSLEISACEEHTKEGWKRLRVINYE